jgi:hypothetical protein
MVLSRTDLYIVTSEIKCVSHVGPVPIVYTDLPLADFFAACEV